jgi:hypothetical protein
MRDEPLRDGRMPKQAAGACTDVAEKEIHSV